MKLPSQYEVMKKIRKPMTRPSQFIDGNKGKTPYKRDKSWKKDMP